MSSVLLPQHPVAGRHRAVVAPGKIRIRLPHEYPREWCPLLLPQEVDWARLMRLVRAIMVEGGVDEAGRMVLAMGPQKAEVCKQTAYRIHGRIENKPGRSKHAIWFNRLVDKWTEIERSAARQRAFGAPARQARLPF